MGTHSKVNYSFCLVVLSVVLSGCGSGGGGGFFTPPPIGPSGRVTQGPVKGATVFADNTAGGGNSLQDVGEVYTKTGEDGNFILPTVPSYNHRLVSTGGTDIITKQPAIQMFAPAGAANITPITTLVALDSTGTVKAKLEALMPAGSFFDADISRVASPAILLVAKSVEALTQSMSSAVITAAGSGQISDAQLSVIQAQTMQSIAVQIGSMSSEAATATLTTPTSLKTTLQAAATSAVANISTVNTNITIPAVTATTLASAAVTATTTALGVSATTAATTTLIPGGEAGVITSDVAEAFVNTVTTASNAAVSSITATPTPPNFTPPPISATGATGGTGSGTGAGF